VIVDWVGRLHESEAGVLLTKQRKRMSPKVMKSWSTFGTRTSTESGWNVYGISVSEEELKKELKRMELIGMKLTRRRKTLMSKVTKLLHPYRRGIYGYGYIHGYPRKICGCGCGYGWEISYPRQP